MVLDALKFNPKVQGQPYEAGRVAFTGQGEQSYTSASVEQYGTGKGFNETNSTGVLGEVTGTGPNGKHKLNMYM